jgi:hypothetical protein
MIRRAHSEITIPCTVLDHRREVAGRRDPLLGNRKFKFGLCTERSSSQPWHRKSATLSSRIQGKSSEILPWDRQNATTNVTDTPKPEFTVDEAVEHAKRAFALKQYEKAVDHYASALELMYVASKS